MRPPRVAFLPDSFHEVNGVAHTSRNFLAFAERSSLPMLCVRAAPPGLHTVQHMVTGSVQTLDLPRSRASVRLEKDLQFDPFFWRYHGVLRDTLQAFQPDIIHITGPSELGMFGAYFARRRGIPLAASWHTNLHEYAATRMSSLFGRFRHTAPAASLARAAERTTLAMATRFYRLADVLFAPNPELCGMLAAASGKVCHLMPRGVDTDRFSPRLRTRPREGDPLTLGFVGRLSVEKNVALLPIIARELATRTGRPIRFLVVGHGSEEAVLRRQLPAADFAGVLRGAALAEAYANMDVLLFPSHTDTFGNVVLEALASGVPAIVTPDGGPKFIVRDGLTGYVVPDAGFAEAVAGLARDPSHLAGMREAARVYAESCTWNAVFEAVYAAYLAV